MRGLQEKIPGLAVGAVGKSCRVSVYRGRDETFWSVGVIVEFSVKQSDDVARCLDCALWLSGIERVGSDGDAAAVVLPLGLGGKPELANLPADDELARREGL